MVGDRWTTSLIMIFYDLKYCDMQHLTIDQIDTMTEFMHDMFMDN